MGRLVSFRDAALGYAHTPALTGLTLDVFGGQALALVGPNGGGKTTLMRGIVGGCQVLSGTVEVDATRIGLVPQSADLDLTFPVSAAEVVTMGLIAEAGWGRRINADMRARVSAALERVNLSDRATHRFGTLSGGQRQRVSIARALLKQAQIYLFDDCLSAVDTDTEEKILHNLSQTAQNTTRIIVSHRVSVARNADYILFLDQGHLIGAGTHTDLYTQNEAYRNYYDTQIIK